MIQERLYHHHFIFLPFFQCKNIFMANYILDGLVHLLCIISHNSEIQIHWVVSWMGTKSGTFSRKIPLFGNWVYQLSRNSEELCHALFQIYLPCISISWILLIKWQNPFRLKINRSMITNILLISVEITFLSPCIIYPYDQMQYISHQW